MVERLCRNYGTPLKQTENLENAEQSLSEVQQDSVSVLVLVSISYLISLLYL